MPSPGRVHRCEPPLLQDQVWTAVPSAVRAPETSMQSVEWSEAGRAETYWLVACPVRLVTLVAVLGLAAGVVPLPG